MWNDREVIRLMIESFKVKPVDKNWRSILLANLKKFMDHGLWGGRRVTIPNPKKSK